MSDNKSNFKTRTIFYIFLLIVLAGMFFYAPITNKINISTAEKCFEAKNYICAFNSYRKAFSGRIDNSEYVSHYVTTLSKIKKIALVQYELNNLMEKYPNNSAVSDIEEIFKNLKNKVEVQYSDNYIANAVQGTNIVHWNVENSPIEVFINSSSAVPSFYIDEIKKAFSDYQKITNNNLKFYYTNNEKDANIIITFEKNISGGKCEEGEDCAKVLGLTENNINGLLLTKSVVQLRTKDTDGSDFTANQIHNIAKHEIGHALGIVGHSFDSDDVMYPVSNDAKWAENIQTLIIKKKDFSKRDIETINLLYKIIPDITNKNYKISKHPEMYMPVAILGTKKQIGEKKVEEATAYVDTVANNFVAQMSLAESYFSSQNYSKAKEIFESALNYANTDKEKFTVYHNLAVIAYQQNDFNGAISYSDLANSYGNENLEDMNSNDIKAYCYVEKQEYGKAQALLEKQISLNPGNAALSATLVGVYVKQFRYIKAVNELKRIKSINPDALKEPMFQQFWLLINFT